MYKEDFMRRAIEISQRALTEPGTEPFGAVVVRDGGIVGEGLNHAEAKNDPTSHGEVEAIRDACRNLATVDLSDCELYTSTEPCPLCVCAMSVSGISRLYFAASLDQANDAVASISKKKKRIDIGRLRRLAGSTTDSRDMPAEQKLSPEAVTVIAAWAAKVRGGAL